MTPRNTISRRNSSLCINATPPVNEHPAHGFGLLLHGTGGTVVAELPSPNGFFGTGGGGLPLIPNEDDPTASDMAES